MCIIIIYIIGNNYINLLLFLLYYSCLLYLLLLIINNCPALPRCNQIANAQLASRAEAAALPKKPREVASRGIERYLPKMQQQQPAPPQIDIGAILQQISMKDPRQRTPMDMSFLAWVQGGGKGPPPMIQAQQQRQKPMVAHQTTLVKPKKQERQEQQQLNQRMPVQPQSLQQQIANRKKPVNKKCEQKRKNRMPTILPLKISVFMNLSRSLPLLQKHQNQMHQHLHPLDAQSTSSSPDKKVDSTNSRPLHPEMEKRKLGNTLLTQ